MKILVGNRYQDKPPLPEAVQVEVMVRQTYGTCDRSNLPVHWFEVGTRHADRPEHGYVLYERYIRAKVWVIEIDSLEALFEVARQHDGNNGLLVRAPDDDDAEGLPQVVPHECER